MDLAESVSMQGMQDQIRDYFGSISEIKTPEEIQSEMGLSAENQLFWHAFCDMVAKGKILAGEKDYHYRLKF